MVEVFKTESSTCHCFYRLNKSIRCPELLRSSRHKAAFVIASIDSSHQNEKKLLIMMLRRKFVPQDIGHHINITPTQFWKIKETVVTLQTTNNMRQN